jgi:hypothetical protein
MRKFLITALTAAAAIGFISTNASASTWHYTVNAFDSNRINVSLCGEEVDVNLAGNGDTRLRFFVEGGTNFNVLDSGRDWTNLAFYQDGGCHGYTLIVQNRGDVYNTFSLAMTNQDN